MTALFDHSLSRPGSPVIAPATVGIPVNAAPVSERFFIKSLRLEPIGLQDPQVQSDSCLLFGMAVFIIAA
jgi:hypothetical protein